MNANLRTNEDGTCNCRPLMGGCFFTDGFGGKCDVEIEVGTPPIHEHKDENGDKYLCGKVFCPYGFVGLSRKSSPIAEQEGWRDRYALLIRELTGYALDTPLMSNHKAIEVFIAETLSRHNLSLVEAVKKKMAELNYNEDCKSGSCKDCAVYIALDAVIEIIKPKV